MICGTQDDLPVRRLEIDRLQHSRNHADALLQFLMDDPFDSTSECREEDDSANHRRSIMLFVKESP